MVRYGIIGIGAMGREHVENLRHIEGAHVTAIADPDEGSSEAGRSQLVGQVAVFEDYRELLSSGLVDAEIGRAHV